jgi:uncharacterized alpha-E superfamily protein
MISRVAESCYWLGRYVERTESVARLVAINRLIVLDAGLRGAQRWQPVLAVMGEQENFDEHVGPNSHGKDEAVQEYLTWSEVSPVSLHSSLRWARENARTTREVISREMWETLNRAWQWLNSDGARKQYRKDRAQFYEHVRSVCAEFYGVAESTMLHEEAFDFVQIGTQLERANQTARLMDVKHHRSLGEKGPDDIETPWQSAQWVAQLRLCAASEPFVKRSREVPTGLGVATFLLQDEAFPRSVFFCLEALSTRLRGVIRTLGLEPSIPALKEVALQLERIRTADVEKLVREGLAEELTRVVDTTAATSEQLRADFFVPNFATAPTG